MNLKGFTLIELLFTLVIFSIVVLFGSVSFSTLINKNEQQRMQDEIRTSVQYAKNQAISLGTSVYLRPINNDLNWSNGMALYTVDKSTREMSRIYQWEWSHPQWIISWKGVHSSKELVFSNNPIQAMSNGRFELRNRSTGKQIVILVNRLGRLRPVLGEHAGHKL